MGFLKKITRTVTKPFKKAAHTVGKVVGKSVKFLGNVVKDVAHTIGHTVSKVLGTVTDVLGKLVSKSLPYVIPALAIGSLALGAISSLSLTDLLASWNLEGSFIFPMAASVEEFVASLSVAYDSFLATIHYSTMLKVSEIAYLTSEAYREQMNKVYEQISKVSQALGYGSEFLNLAFRNARTVILDVSSMLGRSYDIAQITWLKSFSDFTAIFNKQVNRYRNNPALLFEDIDNHLIKPAINTSAKAHQTLLNTVDKILDVTKKTVNETIKLRNDLQKFIYDLPDFVRKEIEPYFNQVLGYFDDFINYNYKPAIERIDQIIAILSDTQSRICYGIHDIVRTITHPGDMLRLVDRLPEDERLRQEHMINEVSTREYRREVAELSKQSRPVYEHLERIRKALSEKLPPVKWAVAEAEAPIYPPMGPVEPRKTWFVGDY